MGLQPIGQNAQVQRLTTALKNICRDYPAGGTVLRELLQNADDAGATEVVYNLRLTTMNGKLTVLNYSDSFWTKPPTPLTT